MDGIRRALVTGGAKGIGRATVRALAARGFAVAIGYNTSAAEAESLVAELQSGGVNAVAFRADLSSWEQANDLYERCRAHFGTIDTLVNNAGVSLMKPLYELTQADYDRVMDTNFRSVFNMCKLFSPDMVSAGFGRIVNVASVWGERGASTETLYSASKAAVIGFSKALNAELAPSNVIVNAVSPGFIDTDMNASLTPSERAEFLLGTALGRAGRAEEVAAVIELLTREDLYISGADIPVTGGL